MQDAKSVAKPISFFSRFRDTSTIVSIVVLIAVWAILQ